MKEQMISKYLGSILITHFRFIDILSYFDRFSNERDIYFQDQNNLLELVTFKDFISFII